MLGSVEDEDGDVPEQLELLLDVRILSAGEQALVLGDLRLRPSKTATTQRATDSRAGKSS